MHCALEIHNNIDHSRNTNNWMVCFQKMRKIALENIIFEHFYLNILDHNNCKIFEFDNMFSSYLNLKTK